MKDYILYFESDRELQTKVLGRLQPFVGRIQAPASFDEALSFIHEREEGVSYNLAFLDIRCGRSELEQLSTLLREVSPKVKLVYINSGYYEQGVESKDMIHVDHYLPMGYSAKQIHYLIHLFLRGAQENPSKSNGNILILDDDESLLLLLQEHLLRLNYFVTTCNQTQELWDHLKSHPYDVIVLDFHMPEVDGLEILRELRKRYEHLFVVGMSSMATPSEIKEFLANGAFTVMKKPLDFPHLGKIFKKFVYQSQHSEDPILAAQESHQKSFSRLPIFFILSLLILAALLWTVDRIVEREGQVKPSMDLPKLSFLEDGSLKKSYNAPL